jgi:hypothetical protein
MPRVRVIRRALFSGTVGRQAEEVSEARDGENNQERPPDGGLGRDRGRQAGEGCDRGGIPGQGPRPQAEEPFSARIADRPRRLDGRQRQLDQRRGRDARIRTGGLLLPKQAR